MNQFFLNICNIMNDILLKDIITLENIIYNKNKKIFENIGNVETIFDIKDPVIVMDTLDSCFSHAIIDSCFSHAIIDSCFPIYWVISELLKNKYIESSNVRIFIRKDNILKYPKKNLSVINAKESTYNGFHKEVIEFLTKDKIIFEHLIDKNLSFKKCFIYPKNDNWQRSPWNSSKNYTGRNVSSVLYTDDIIYSKLKNFRNEILQRELILIPCKNELIIIDRKYNRKFDKNLLEDLVTEAKKNTSWNFTGVYLLEDFTVKEQIKLFSRSKIIIARHGSSLINTFYGLEKIQL